MKETDEGRLASVLRSIGLFAGLGETALMRLARSSCIRRLARGQTLFSQGDAAEAFYVLLSGCIGLLLDSANGRELVINEMRAGDGFGELGLITGRPRSAGAVALEPSEVLVVTRDGFQATLDAEPGLARRLLETTAQRLDVASEREGALAFLDAPGRLARVLLQLDRQASEEGYVTISQEALARRVGLARQTVAKLLGKWRRAGWLVTGRGRIFLINRVALRRQAEETEW